MAARSPTWFRLDVGAIDSPKLQRAIREGGHAAAVLWLQGISYSVQHLTDGWIPEPMPRRWGCNGRQTRALESCGLWVPLLITDDGGWLIHDFPQFQVSREGWERKVAQRREAARQRWDR